MAEVTLKNVKKSYGTLEVVHGIDLNVKSGEFVVFVGPSGCGKSTLLRMIAGLEHISEGEISIGGKIMNDVPSPDRGISMVFQSYALYPHMNVFENMAFGLKLAKTPAEEIDQRVRNAAEVLQIQDYLDRMPKALSGGQRQRVAIGRAIVRDPKVFLFDEPLSNLDSALRAKTRIELAKLHESLNATMIYVTHDQVEAMTLADRIVVLNGGRIEQVGTPLELYQTPDNIFVAGFISSPTMNFINIESKKAGDATLITLPGGVAFSVEGDQFKRSCTLGIRPERLSLVDEKDAMLSGELEVLEKFGEYSLAYLRLSKGTELTIKLDGTTEFKSRQFMHVRFDIKDIQLFDSDGNAVRKSV